MSAEHVMYRVYDAEDRLIYVGSTGNFKRRYSDHCRRSWWFLLADHFDLEFFPNKIQAHGAETRAIAQEAPAFNLNSLGTTPPDMLALTVEEQRVLRDWAAANPGRVNRLPLAFHWALAEIRGAA